MQRLPFATYRDQTNRIIYLHENTRNERLMQKKTPITDPLCRSVQCLRPFLIVRPKTLTRDSQNGNLWGEPFHQCESPDPLVAPGRGRWRMSPRSHLQWQMAVRRAGLKGLTMLGGYQSRTQPVLARNCLGQMPYPPSSSYCFDVILGSLDLMAFFFQHVNIYIYLASYISIFFSF